MKPLQQFFALLRFQAFASPQIWIFPVAFGLQPCISLMVGDTWRGLTIALSTSSMMWMGPMMIAAFLFTPEVWTGAPGTGLQTQQSLQGFSADFLLTRAVDRPVIFRARAALFWLLIAVPALILLALAAWKAPISIEVPLQPPGVGAFYLEALPGASVTKTTKTTETITSPAGRLAIVSAMGLLSLVTAAFWQGFVFAICRLKFKRWVFFACVILVIGSPFFVIKGRSHFLENLIFLILRHPVAAVGLTVIFVAAAWAFSAARAKRIEYP